MNIKNLFKGVMCLLFSLVLVMGMAACGSTEKLSAPTIGIKENRISWSPVDNADKYDIYENQQKITSTSSTLYTITQTVAGTYEYTVKAISNNSKFTESDTSNSVTYKVRSQLTAPVITLEDDNTITWNTVANAGSYDVYENDVLIDTVENDASANKQVYAIVQEAIGVYEYTVIATTTDDDYAKSQPSNAVIFEVKAPKTKLNAPVLNLDEETGIITWQPVTNAFSYNVTMNGKNVGSQVKTTYTISVTESGDYTFRVKAIPGNTDKFIESEYSEPVTYTYVVTEPETLDAPVLNLDEENRTIYWDAIDNAESYAVYENNSRVTDTTETSYVITSVAPGEYTYKVRAIGDDENYISSGFSESVSLTIEPSEVTYTIYVVIPAGYSSTINVGLFSGDSEIVSEVAEIDTESSQATVELKAINNQDYTVKVKNVASGFSATQTTVTARRTTATLTIMRYDSNSALKLGTNSFTVRANSNPDLDQRGTQFDFTFLAEDSGIYSIDATAETKRLDILVDNELVIDTGSSVKIGWFSMEKGQVVQITCFGADAGQYVFDLVKGEVTAPNLQIGTGYGDRPNYIPPINCTRKLVIETPGYFEFCFTPSLNGRRVTMTIDGEDYVFGTGETDIDRVTLALNRGEHEITFKVENTDEFLEFYYIYFFISYAQG